MTGRLEDILGKCSMIIVFMFLLVQQSASLVGLVQSRESTDYWELTFSSRVLSLVFVFLVVVLTIFRLPPRRSAGGIEPRLSALAGTFALMILVVLPTGTPGPELLATAIFLIGTGMALATYALAWLGRSFSIMASARRLVTTGPYGLIRHPLYVAEAISALGIVIANWSAAAVMFGLAQLFFQYRRMLNEERVLRDAFPEYDEYARRVPMIIPKLPGKHSLPAK